MTKKLKILQVYPYFYPAWSYGGVTRISYEISKKLADNGNDVVVYATDTLDKKSRIKIEENPIKHNGIKIYYFKNISNYVTSRYKIPFPIEMPFIVKNQIKEFDIIHLHGHRHVLSLIVFYFAKRYKIPYILQTHGDIPYVNQRTIVKKIYDFIWGYEILKNASKVIAVTKTEAEQYKKIGVSEDKIVIIPNGVDLSLFHHLPKKGTFRDKYRISLDAKIVLYLGRLHKIKGIDLLIDAFSELQKQVPMSKLVIVGPDEGFYVTLRNQASRSNVGDNIIFTGPLYGEDKLSVYVDADAYVLPSIYEAFAITVLEAWMCGTPVIVTKGCSISDLVGNAGLVVEYDKYELKNAILKVFKNDDEIKKFKENGKRLVTETLNIESSVNKIEELYLQSISGG